MDIPVNIACPAHLGIHHEFWGAADDEGLFSVKNGTRPNVCNLYAIVRNSNYGWVRKLHQRHSA
jgi:hypothetical protein